MRSSRGRVLPGVVILLLPVALLAAGNKKGPARLTAKEVVRKCVAARGGVKAWKGVQSMVWNGKMDVGYADSATRSSRYADSAMATKRKGARTAAPAAAASDARKQVQVPFVLEMKRGARSRIEIEFAGKKAVQVYDGKKGWLLRPYLNRDDWESMTQEQANSQQGKWELDGPLIDSAAKGTKVQLESMERVEGRDAYKLKLTRTDGAMQHVWIDAKSFLDVKVEGTPRRMDGKVRTVWVNQRDFRTINGVKLPFVLETVVDGYADTHKMIVDRVALNPKLDDGRFVKPKA